MELYIVLWHQITIAHEYYFWDTAMHSQSHQWPKEILFSENVNEKIDIV